MTEPQATKTPQAPPSLSVGRIALRKLRRHQLAMAGLYTLIFLYITCFLFSGFFAPYHYDNERRDLSYHPPTRIRVMDEEGTFRRPFVYASSYQFDEFQRRVFTEDTSTRYPVRFFARGDAHRLLGLIPSQVRLFGVDAPGRIYLFGADSRGRDLLSRIVYGGRVSLSIGLVGVIVSFTIGMIVGGISGFFGGKIDTVIQRICEMIMMVPSFFLMLALRAALPADIGSVKVYFMIVLIMSFIGWAGMARVIRGMVLAIRSSEFVEAARAIGQSNFKIINRHVLPQTLSYAIVSVTLAIPGYILGESALSLLGLGIQDPHASWGNLLTQALAISQIQRHPWILLPGFFIFATVMAFNFLGDGLRDAFDPRSQLVGKAFKEGAKLSS